MKRILAGLIVCLGLIGCGSGHSSHQHGYTVTLPTGHKVVQAHSPALAAPKPSAKLPAAFVPERSRGPVVKRALFTAPHRAADRPRAVAANVPVSLVEQFDSVTISTVPAWARYVAGYVNGSYQTYRQMLHRWPVVVGISVSRGVGADCLDMEPGNPGPDAAGPWAAWQLTQSNLQPCLYSMLSWFPQIDASLRAYLGSNWRSKVRLWDANWTYTRHLDAGYDCTQWTDHAYNVNLDESTCSTAFYGQPKPPVDPYARFTKTRYSFGRDHASEYKTVKTWDGNRCRNPVRRTVCKTSRAHLILLRDRLWHVAWSGRLCVNVATCGPPNWRYAHRGYRLQQLVRRIGSWTAKR